MKTTLDHNDQLLADAKALAAQQRTSLTRVIEEGLQLRLRARKALTSGTRAKVRLPALQGPSGAAHPSLRTPTIAVSSNWRAFVRRGNEAPESSGEAAT